MLFDVFWNVHMVYICSMIYLIFSTIYYHQFITLFLLCLFYFIYYVAFFLYFMRQSNVIFWCAILLL
jgi:hypothetical protein